jgi:hypothetical protein
MKHKKDRFQKGKMQFRETYFEIKRLGDDIWQKVSEKAFLEKLADCVDPISPAITRMMQGNEIETQREIYRIRR